MSIEFWHFRAMSPRLCAIKPLFHRHFRDFVRNHGDRGLKFAQQCRHRKSFWIWTKEDQKARKSPKIAHFCSALPCKVVCEAAQCRHAYSCNKIRQSSNSIISFQIAVFCVLGLGWRTWSLSFFNRHTGRFCGLHGDIHGRKEEGLNGLWLLSFLRWIAITTSQQPDCSLYFRRDFSIYHPDFLVQVDFTDPPKLEGGVWHKPLCCRRCRRTCDEAEVVYHPDSFTCLIFDRRKSGCRGNADSLYILLFCW